MRIIIVEDNPGDVHLIKYALKNYGYNGEVVFLEDGSELVSLLEGEEHLIQLIIMDINMPIMGGIETLKVVSTRPNLSEAMQGVPVIMFSSSSLSTDILESYSLGANAYVKKPLSLDEYVSSISKILKFWVD